MIFAIFSSGITWLGVFPQETSSISVIIVGNILRTLVMDLSAWNLLLVEVAFRKLREGFWTDDVAVVKNYERYNAARYGCVGKVEYRLEE